MSAPISHLEEGQNLTADALVDLYEVQLRNVLTPTFVRFTYGVPGGMTNWAGKDFDHVPLKFAGLSRAADEEKSRPSLTVVNPEGAFNKFARNGHFDRAFVTRYRVLGAHLAANVGLSQNLIFYISRVTSATANQGLSFELRTLSDGPDQLIPARTFIPPEFPFVTLQ